MNEKGGVAITTFVVWIVGFILGVICMTFSVGIGLLVWIVFGIIGFLVLVTEGESGKKVFLRHTHVINPPANITQTTNVDSSKNVVVKCKSCGALNDEDSSFCKKCGKTL